MDDYYVFDINNGTVLTDTDQIKENTQQEYKEALSQDLSLEDATPQGRLIDIDTTIKKNILNNNANLVNSFNLNLSFGSLLDNIAANFGFYRQPATQSRVMLTITGQPNTVIAENSKVSSENRNIYFLEKETTIGENGTVDALFISVEFGAINDPTGTINQIIDGCIGWETVNNNTQFEYIGNEIESDASFKRKIKNGALYTGKGLLHDYIGAILKVDGVKKCYVQDNYEKTDITYKGVTIKGNTIYCCVYGGEDEEVARAIFDCKSSGCGYTGNTQVVIDDIYTIEFQRPTLIDIFCQITVKIINNSSADIQQEIKQSIIDFSKGNLVNFGELGIGDNVNCFNLASVVGAVINGIAIIDLKIGKNQSSLSSEDIVINIDELSNFLETNIDVILI